MKLVIRSDSPDVYMALFSGGRELVCETWQAGRELSVQLLDKIRTMSEKAKIHMNEIDGIIVYQGPGSYTGLRISISVANALGYSYDIPVVATSGDDWLINGLKQISSKTHFLPVSPEYGGDVYTTTPKK